MAYLLSDELVQINISGDDWVKIKKEITYWDFVKIIQQRSVEGTTKMMLLEIVKEWSLKDNNGSPLPCVSENILRLDSESSKILFLEINKIIDEFKNTLIDKKKQKNSSPQSDIARKPDSPTI